MDNKTVKERIVEILDTTFQVIDQCYTYNYESLKNKPNFNNAGSRIMFPSYRNGDCRISEQELRFLFIEKFNQYCQYTGWNAFYSVETPTKNPHNFSGIKSQSALFDVCIYDESGKRVCLIEFKALNPQKSDYIKDFVKLNKEKVSPRFFVQLLKAQDSGTITNIRRKIESSINNVDYVCHTLNPNCRRTEYISNDIKKDGWIKLK